MQVSFLNRLKVLSKIGCRYRFFAGSQFFPSCVPTSNRSHKGLIFYRVREKEGGRVMIFLASAQNALSGVIHGIAVAFAMTCFASM